MRNIIFKAKTESGKWIEGDLIHYESGEMAIVEKPFSKYGHEATEIAGRTKVIPETVCQYTGLTDKNGNRIWENDICRYIDANECRIKEETFVVKYGRYAELGNINMGFYIDWIKTDYYRSDLVFWVENKNVEVIGNIFDNPELLKGGAE